MNDKTTQQVLETAGNIVEGNTKPGLYMLLPCPTLWPSEENRAMDAYVLADWTVADFQSVAFMFACFTLLLNDDDNF